MTFIPVLTTLAGSALTREDWSAIGIKAAAVYLDTLLMKPGIALLKQIESLALYMGWNQPLVLNASLLKLGNNGNYTLRSPYDGHLEHFSLDDILTLINHLKPDMLILPRGVFADAKRVLLQSIRVFISYEDVLLLANTENLFGMFMEYNEQTDLDVLLKQRESFPHLACYITAHECSLSFINTLQKADIQWLESDRPAQDAVDGFVYNSKAEVVSIQAEERAILFQPLDAQCACVGCSSKLTSAYFHHLYAQTPGLCQRFLIQHNVMCMVRTSVDSKR